MPAGDETDFVVLRHELGVTWSDGNKERREVTMAIRGDPASHTAMAKTVGLPTAIAAKMVLDGKISTQHFYLVSFCSELLSYTKNAFDNDAYEIDPGLAVSRVSRLQSQL